MLDFLVEQRLSEAVSRGELDNLPGAGRPLALDDDPLVPEDLRLAYALGKLALLRTRIEARYYQETVAKLGR